jgi:putative oxidoreductase
MPARTVRTPAFLTRLSPFAATVLRIAVGVVFIAHGMQKFNNGVDGFAGFLTSLNVPLPEVMKWVVPILEVGGGVLLILGLGTRIVALLLALEMVFTISLVKLDVGFIGAQGTGAELDFLLLAGGLTLALLGPGALSADRAVGLEPGPVV